MAVGRQREKQPRRVWYLKVLCAFAAGMLAVLLLSLLTGALFHIWDGEGPALYEDTAGGPFPEKGALPAGGQGMGVETSCVRQALDAPFIDQREKYPTGCESVSAVMALQYAGVDITVEEFIDGYLPQGEAPHRDGSGTWVGANPWKAFLGSPYEESGWGCYVPVITGALERVLQEEDGVSLEVRELEGEELSTLCRDYVENGMPVIVWATISMEEPVPSTTFVLEDTGELFTWMYPLHCLLLTGECGGSYLFNDPLEGKNVSYPKEQVETAYAGVGMQAVVLVPAG